MSCSTSTTPTRTAPSPWTNWKPCSPILESVRTALYQSNARSPHTPFVQSLLPIQSNSLLCCAVLSSATYLFSLLLFFPLHALKHFYLIASICVLSHLTLCSPDCNITSVTPLVSTHSRAVICVLICRRPQLMSKPSP